MPAEGREKILALDDEIKWLNTIRLILSPYYDLSLTTDPAKAIEFVKSDHYSLIILDQQLPNTSGLQVLSEIRKIVPDLCAIMFTGYADVDSAVASMKIGALDYLSKGAADLPTELRARVSEALEKKLALERARFGREASKATTQAIVDLIAAGESIELEFKSSARWDVRASKINKELEKVIVKTVAAFLNSEKGGTLLIGVDDSGAILGLEQDYLTLGKRKDRDGYENFLTSILLDSCGKECSPLIQITFHRIDDKDICHIAVKPSPKPVFVTLDKGQGFFIRTGNSTRPLLISEAVEYCKIRWK